MSPPTASRTESSGTKRGIRLLVAACAIALFGGCVAVQRYTGSRSAEAPPKARWKPGDGVTRELNDVTVYVQVQNHRRAWSAIFLLAPIPVIPIPGKGSDQQLEVLIELEPRDASFSFDPGRLVLTPDGRTPIVPSGFWGPGNSLQEPNGGSWGLSSYPVRRLCGVPRREGSGEVPAGKVRGIPADVECFNCGKGSPPAKVPEGPVSLTGPSCFVLLFPARVRAKEAFALSIDGLIRAGAPVDVPVMHFRKGACTEYFTLGVDESSCR